MTIETANHLKEIPSSPTLALSALVKAKIAAGDNVIDLSAGEPDFKLPEAFSNGIIDALNKGHTTYPPVVGILPLRQAVANDLKERHHISYTPDQVIIGTGAKQPLALAFQTVLNSGDEAIIPTPYWVSYADQVRLCSATPIFVTCDSTSHYKLTPQALAAVLTKKTRVIILGSPSNPTGALYTADELAAIGNILKDYPKVLVIADQIYDQLVYDGHSAPSIVTICPFLYDQTIIIDGMSKAYAATGLRLGWAAGPAHLIKVISTIQGHTTSGACSIIQHGAQAMLNAPDRAAQVATMVAAYQKRRDALIATLSAIKGLRVFKPQGAFYLWCDITGLMADDKEFAKQLLDTRGVAVVPGSAFGAPGHIRLHFAASDEVLDKAAKRIKDYCLSL